ncbi:GNAT family N-acetyltransferase [Croceibacterium ferulae]|uniref:GNAT family N-acetyltransferase n=1 Tax=Croceibacterium ferulae TaxID=1854641 RepID=UPI000EACFE3E|nr:GNAT family N-acetyltransferase [Croceibacterium ferulae]
MPDPIIRDAVPGDAAAIAAIYAHHVRHGTATFDIDPPAADAWAAKIAGIAGRNSPFIVAMMDGAVVGYAYAAQFRDRPAYAGTCENSIYVAADQVGRGLGAALLTALVAKAADAGFGQMIAVIGGAEPASVAVHARCGFVEAGRLRNVGRKFGRLLDTVYMQRDLQGC